MNETGCGKKEKRITLIFSLKKGKKKNET